jgi:histidinol-phosphate/aromatic aminotransferase/cobyric acid decarboxylase-like protein
VSHLLQRLAAAVIAEHGDTFVEATETYGRRRTEFVSHLRRAGLSVQAPSGLNVWVSVPDPASAVAACLDAGFAVRSGDPFVLDDTKAVRVTTSTMTPGQAESVAGILARTATTGRRHTRSG